MNNWRNEMKSINGDSKNSLRYDSDYDFVKLLMIQRKIEQCKNNKQIISNLVSGLTWYEKNKLIQLYTSQICSLNNSVNNYKNKIIRERKMI